MSGDSEKPPLLFKKQFGKLVPANQAATNAVSAISGENVVRVRITRMTANQRRRAFYFVMLDVAADALTDRTGNPWDAELLHGEMKRLLKLGDTWTTPSGREVFKPRSTSDKAMSEPDRARWLDRCAHVLSTWLQVPVETLMDEARARDQG